MGDTTADGNDWVDFEEHRTKKQRTDASLDLHIDAGIGGRGGEAIGGKGASAGFAHDCADQPFEILRDSNGQARVVETAAEKRRKRLGRILGRRLEWHIL